MDKSSYMIQIILKPTDGKEEDKNQVHKFANQKLVLVQKVK